MRFLSNFLVIIFCTLASISCTSNMHSRSRVSDVKAWQSNFSKELVRGNDFWFTTYQRIKSESDPITIYIEGDGNVRQSRTRISNNPTPNKPMLLKLAAQDLRPNVVYLARPCQYTPLELNKQCSNAAYWTDQRMSEESVNAMNDAIKKIAGNKKINLIGFSGGGGIAVLIAAKNQNIKSILTIAGNLDHIEFNKFHKIRPMIGSLNPIDYAQSINNIPQLHISGAKDNIVPSLIANKFVNASLNQKCIQQEVIESASHSKGWDNSWKYILSIPIMCK